MVLALSRFCGCAVDSFQRLNRWFWLAAVLMIATASCQRANAETQPATPNYTSAQSGTIYRFNGAGQSYQSVQSACDGVESSTFRTTSGNCWNVSAAPTAIGSVSSGNTCRSANSNPSYTSVINCGSAQVSGTGYFCSQGTLVNTNQCVTYSCPSTGGWTLNGTNCTRNECPGDQTRKPDGTCGCQPWADQQNTWSHSYPTPLRQWPPPVVRCISSCEYRGQPFSANASTGQVWFSGGMTGSICSGPDEPEYDPPAGQDPPSDPPSEPETPTNDESACLRSGGSPGEVNGQPVCLPRDTPGNPRSPGETNERTTNPDGSTTERTETPVTTCSTEGCTTTTTIVERVCEPGGSPCTTTTTTRTEPTDKGSDGEDQGDPFCESNPTDPTCKRSAWAGTCGAFTCDGDAIQCAIAQEQHKRNCELLTDTGDLARADAVAAFNSESAEFDKSTLTTTTPLDSISGQTLYASALSDQSYIIHGQTITIPFSSLVDYLSYAGLAFMIVCGMVSVRIFSTVLG